VGQAGFADSEAAFGHHGAIGQVQAQGAGEGGEGAVVVGGVRGVED
jgi:hypothetical protein